MQIKSERRSNPERSAQMRARLIDTARRLFVARGYAETSTPVIVSEAGVTRGALYHHFPDKQSIFQAVVEAESAAIAEAIERADMPDMPALQRLLAGANAYVDAMQTPGRTRLLLVEGPAILGRDAMRQIEMRNGDASLRTGLNQAMEEGTLPRLPIDALAALLSAMFERAAAEIADGMPQTDVKATLQHILHGLTAQPEEPGPDDERCEARIDPLLGQLALQEIMQ